MSDALHVVILAAGAGKRMVSDLPKVLHRIAGRPMLDHILQAARTQRPAAIHVVYGHAGDAVRAAFAGDATLDWVHQAEQLGTGHAASLALRHIPDDARVLVLLGDGPLITPATLSALVAAGRGSLAVLADVVPDPRGYGRVILDAQGRVAAIVEERDVDDVQRAIDLVNTGVICAAAVDLRDWLARIGNSNAQGEYYLTDIFALAAVEGRPAECVRCLEPLEAEGANDPWQLAQLERRYQLRQARALCLAGARLADPARIDVRGNVRVGRDVEIDVNVILEGEVELGDGVRIGPFCRLRDVRLAAGTEVRAHCDLEGVVAEGAVHIGPFARLRPGTELAAGVHIGNFVETKATRMDAGAKANHLTYLGDAKVGAAVNVGAGTITCNYDGANKHRTVIGAGAFIGSNSALVAPVIIGEDATIGAGSVITRNAPAGALSVARARQTTVPGYERPKKPR
ncbi:bifunctional UDP-N-acetylglucosamine diphosphorylase/glucosamine-1-phosphate N-acetyltransferase GlmU [Pseudofulvimonas gallinarii]|uniref:Bifunctional protein GlmU n=1 Tax=Pseudofulvimonas gallinarii TaxID=634155 RepID=A0A4R3LFM4_9GAMM|nr:bifunctional UDP-N-acetylglucosamine diphosphorylase/glucosamine-1-phosphate N-acetyltransferase GlmU [Pseudofulvimonas gallinarii]TCS97184.1 UDP-N-acetylglucosamine pyrophosphorylase /glucosamine-1-phosphate N-acetyltransferase [Pseudofulvimonas gallinarii]THD12541.1 UDP-N-acetylglucosamine diphosphorylase/glucosamine-1-phosphate N-acetyltransferase [Pseudofulvimonas gallinarii]